LKVCNLCGKAHKEYTVTEIEFQMPYGSRYDGNIYQLNLCPDCMDTLIEMIDDYCSVSFM